MFFSNQLWPGEKSRKLSLSTVHHSSYCQIREECKRSCIRTSRSARSFMPITRAHDDVHSASRFSSVRFDEHEYRQWLSARLIEFLSRFPLVSSCNNDAQMLVALSLFPSFVVRTQRSVHVFHSKLICYACLSPASRLPSRNEHHLPSSQLTVEVLSLSDHFRVSPMLNDQQSLTISAPPSLSPTSLLRMFHYPDNLCHYRLVIENQSIRCTK